MAVGEIVQKIKTEKIIAIIRGFDPEECLRLTEALYAGGIQLVEVTFDQKSPNEFYKTAEAIKRIGSEFKGQVLAGAGTVLDKDQADRAYDAGASYMISPDTNEEVIRHAKELGMVSIPGAMSPSEAVRAYNAGADFVKIFPAVSLGSAYIKAIKAPLGHIDMLAVGGVSQHNIREFLDAGACGAGVGGMLTKREYLLDGHLDKITELAKEYVKNAGIKG